MKIMIFYVKKHPVLTGTPYKTMTQINNLNITINTLAGECIPNKQIRVKSFELPWITCSIKKQIRK